MAARSKGRRKMTVNGRKYLWYVKDDRESADKVLHVISEDKKFIVHYHLHPEYPRLPFLTVIGQEFGGIERHGGTWRRFICPAWEIDGMITPRSIRNLIEWALSDNKEVVEVDWRGAPIG